MQTAENLSEKIDAFLSGFVRETLAVMSEAEFAIQRDSLVKKMRESDKSVHEEYARHAVELGKRGRQGGYRWRRAEEQAEAVEALTLPDLVQFFEGALGTAEEAPAGAQSPRLQGGSRSQLKIQISGPKHSPKSLRSGDDGDSVDGVAADGATPSEEAEPPQVMQPPRQSAEEAEAEAGLSDGICTCGDDSCVDGARSVAKPFTTFLLPRRQAAAAVDKGQQQTKADWQQEPDAQVEVDLSHLTSFNEFKSTLPLFPQMV